MVHTLITLFPPETTDFTTNGLGYLSEATSCVVTEEANGEFELEMTYPVTGRRFKDITNRCILFTKPNPVDPPQAFRIYEFSKPMNGLVTFYASHISYDLSGYPVKPFKANSVAEAFTLIDTNSVVKTPFTFWTDKSTSGKLDLQAPMPIRNLLGGVEGSILDIYKGQYKFDNFNVRLYENRGADRGVVIRYGKNLLDVKQEENCSNVYTDILPYWAGTVDDEPQYVLLPEVTLPTKGTYNYRKIAVLDFSSEFQEKPFVVDLREVANKYISDNDLGVPTVSIDVSFVQLEQTEEYEEYTLLERVELFDTVTVEFPEYEISSTAKVTKTVYDVLTGRYNSVTLGDIRSTMSSTVANQTSEYAESQAKLTSQLQQAQSEATKWITNGRGYMVAVKNADGQWMEICSLDKPDIATALNVWRWNNGGFGHSSHGYNGPYDIAITQDGKINADFILSGEMRANRIYGGTLTLGGANNQAGLIRIEGSGSGLDDDKFTTISNMGIGSDFINTNHVTLEDDGMDANAKIKLRPDGNDDKGVLQILAETGNTVLCTLTGGLYYNVGNVSGDSWEEFRGAVIKTNGYGIFVDKIYIKSEMNGISLTSNYAQRIQTYDTTTIPIQSDIGKGILDEDGECIISIDDIFSETTNLNVEYYVFLQKEGEGDIWIKEKKQNYFIVNGTPNLSFSWELKARRTGEEYTRLERYGEVIEDHIDYETIYDEEYTTLTKKAIDIAERQLMDSRIIYAKREEALYQ